MMLSFAVVLISYVVYASEPCVAVEPYREPIECIECSTMNDDPYCADPFNDTHYKPTTKTCDESCAKWIRKPKIGPMHYVRTCSSRLSLRMPVAHVCMSESRPGDGLLCFCRKSLCNSSPGFHGHHWAQATLPSLILSFIALLLVHTYSSGEYVMDIMGWCLTAIICVALLQCILPGQLLQTMHLLIHWVGDIMGINTG